MKKLTSIPGFLWDKGAMEDGGRRIWLTTQELIDEQLSVVMKYGSGKEFGFFTFKAGESEIKEEELVDLPEVIRTNKKEKSSAQQLREALYRLHEKMGGKSDGFDKFYKDYMAKHKRVIIQKINDIDNNNS